MMEYPTLFPFHGCWRVMRTTEASASVEEAKTAGLRPADRDLYAANKARDLIPGSCHVSHRIPILVEWTFMGKCHLSTFEAIRTAPPRALRLTLLLFETIWIPAIVSRLLARLDGRSPRFLVTNDSNNIFSSPVKSRFKDC
jgi:hypothetical protein